MAKTTMKYVVMGFGLGGNHGAGFDTRGAEFTSSWYLSPARFQQFIDNGHYPADQVEGCILINKVPALEKDYGLAVRAPMLKLSLKECEIDKASGLLANYSAAMVVAGVAEHAPAIGLMAATAITNPSYVGLDYVGPLAYTEWWRLHGAIIGKVEDGEVVWEAREKSASKAAQTSLSLPF